MQPVTGRTWADVGVGTYVDDLKRHTWKATSVRYDVAQALVVVDLVDAAGVQRSARVDPTRPAAIWETSAQQAAGEPEALSVLGAILGAEPIEQDMQSEERS